MPILKSPRRERFCQEIAAGRSLREAHGAAGYQADRRNALNLRKQDDVARRITELLESRQRAEERAAARAVERIALSKEYVLSRLMENVERAMTAEPVHDSKGGLTGTYTYQGAVANRALELLGKELGMFIDRKELKRVDEFDNMTAAQLRQYLIDKLTGPPPDDGSTKH